MTTLAEVRESIEVLRRIEDSCPYPYEVFEQHVERLRTWLDAQPAAPTERWEPVAEINRMSGTFIRPDDTSTPLRGLSILSEDGRICIDWRDGGVEVDLPDNVRLCRRVEVQP